MTTRTERIAILKARLEQLEQREKSIERKQRTRRLILLGTVVEDMMLGDPAFAADIVSRAEKKLTRKIDRDALRLAVGAVAGEPTPKRAWPVGYAASFADMPDDFERPEPLPSSEHRDLVLEEL